MSFKTSSNILLDIEFIIEKAKIVHNMKVADLGCGSSGYFLYPIAQVVGKHGKVFAVDILKTVLETIDRKIKLENIENIKTIWSDLEIFGATKIESNSLDTTLLINTLYQSRKRKAILREAIRMLKKKGTLLVVEWKNVASPFGPPSDKLVATEPLKQAAQKLGLQIDDEFNAGPYHYGILFQKV